MLIMSAKLSKGKIVLCLLAAAALLWLVLTLVSGDKAPVPEASGRPNPTNVADNEARVAYLASCGCAVEPEPIQTQEVAIPQEFNEVFTRYNALQQSQGFDLTAYAGKHAKRYVYRLSSDEEVHATLIIYKDTVIAADLSSTKDGGFLRALLPTGDAA